MTKLWVLPRLGPAFGECQRAGAERAALAIHRPGLAGRFDAVAREARAERRYEERADAVFAAALARVGVDEQGIADLVPGEGDFLVVRDEALGPEISGVAGLGEFGVGDRDCRVGGLGIQHALD